MDAPPSKQPSVAPDAGRERHGSSGSGLRAALLGETHALHPVRAAKGRWISSCRGARSPQPKAQSWHFSLTVLGLVSSSTFRGVPMGIFEGHLRVHKGDRFAVVASRWNDFIVERLTGGAQDCLRRHGAADDAMDLIKVPGSFELPLAALQAAKS